MDGKKSDLKTFSRGHVGFLEAKKFTVHGDSKNTEARKGPGNGENCD